MTEEKTQMTRATFIVAALLLAAVPALSPAPAVAADCPRGALDKQYCDWNGDRVADLPLDEKQWVNPDTIIFSYTPVEEPAVYEKVWDGFLKHMTKITGREVAFFPVQSNAAQMETGRGAGRGRVCENVL